MVSSDRHRRAGYDPYRALAELRAALEVADLTMEELWYAYVCVGGDLTALEFAEIFAGSSLRSEFQYRLIAQAFSEHFEDSGRDRDTPLAPTARPPRSVHPRASTQWSEIDERIADLWRRETQWRQEYRVLARDTVRVLRKLADTRRYVAQVYDRYADRAAGDKARGLRARARRFDELAERAMRLAEREEVEASRR